jgi:mono/diheme cytochrome c family protein
MSARAWASTTAIVMMPLVSALAQPQSAAPSSRGKAVYDKWCAGCHGDTGAGDGSAATAMLPRPRDFTKGVFQIRTTATGELPTDGDLRHVVDEGMPGTAMPGWKGRITEGERDDVIAYLKTFSQFFAGATPKAIALGKAPGGSKEGVAVGRATYEKLECFKCHGQAGRGDGKSAPTLTDDWDHPIRAADLSASWKFNGGSSVEQIYARLRTGLDGTPMPSFSDALEAKVVSDEELWRVAQYVRSLSPEKLPAVREVVRAALATRALPAGPDDSSWAAVERYYVPLVGQIVVKPRWFAPTVESVWVQALHDGKSLALRLSWHDPSRSPDPVWGEWFGRVTQTMTNVDGPPEAQQGPDRLTVQFPPRLTDDAERPYFLGGSARRPVHVWRWSSTPDSLEVGAQTGLGRFAATPGAGDVAHAARFANGEWALQLTRALVPRDTASSPTFIVGRAIPVAFFVADGSNGEDDVRSAVSTWYAVYLDVPTPPRVYAAPIVTMLVTAGLGSLVVLRAQRRERGNGGSTLEG